MIVAESDTMKQLVSLAKRAAASNAPIMIVGENGTGKELFAQLIHDSSQRVRRPYVRVNCAALVDHLVSSELFGHEKGSFTDAVSSRQGRFEIASGGSLFLDEISEVSTATQAKLLRVLESGEFERVGSSESLKHDARIISSSNRCLPKEIAEGRFRRDLYHRINVIEIAIPALRNRREEIPVLANHFLQRFKGENEMAIRGFSANSLEKLADHDWPGNVRELRNVIQRACVLTPSEVIDSDSIRFLEDARTDQLPNRWLDQELVETEREIILAALHRYGSQAIAAKHLGITPRTLTNKLKKYRESESLKAA